MLKALACAVALLAAAASAPASPPAARPQSADRILGRYLKAQGKRAVARVTSTTAEGTVTTPDGARGRFVFRTAGPDRLRLDVEAAGATETECYNGKSAWRSDARGLRTLTGADAQTMRLAALVAAGRFRDLRRHRVAAIAGGDARADGREAAAVELSLGAGRMRVLFDAESGMPLQAERRLEGAAEEVVYGDYRRVDGLLEPFSVRIRRGGAETTLAVERLEHNRPPDEAAFRMPSGEAAPDLAALFAAIRANQARVEALRERYGFRETRVDREDDGKGTVRVKETRVYEVTPVAGRLVRRLISVDGKELTGGELEKARRSAQKDVEEALAAREERDRRRREGKADEEDDDVSIMTFLNACELTSVRRESLRGQRVLAFDFEPRPGFKARTLGERIVSRLAGTMWVDEGALQVARLEARLLDSVKIGGGLVGSLSPASAIVMEQEKVDGEVWLPSFVEVNLTARLFLFAKVSQNGTARFSDYKRFDVDSDYTVGGKSGN